MAGLFKNKIIKENLGTFEVPNFEEKLSVLKSWLNAYKNGELQKKTETQCEQSFNQDIFVKVLGYETFPRKVYSLLPKANVETGGGQMPDAILGYFDQEDKRVIGVVEIKDANTPLDKSQYRQGNFTPIQQAFKYKPQYKECGFVIATNFIEIRLFRDNQLDYEQFTLKELVDQKDDYFNFRKFYYLLSAQNFISKSGQTSTEKLLSAIRIEQEEITNKFYKEYKTLREDLIKDIVKNNKVKRSEFYNLIVEKAQKIIDRIVFICFFEDAGLLPENKLTEVVEYGDKAGLSIWSVMKDFFVAVDSGSVKMEIPNGYNGELFKQDNDLNNLIISDKICKKFVKLSRFDFSEDLSVNILGHIFEQSITDLEKLKSFSAGSNEEQNKKLTKRKKEGIFYTPEYIVDCIIKNSLGRYLEEKEFEILNKYNLDDRRLKDAGYNKKIIKTYIEYSNFLKTIKILDPACGSGAFLVRVYDYLLTEHKRVFRIISEAEGTAGNSLLISDEEYIKPILENNIYGVDLNSESVEITKLSLWLKSAKKGQKIITLKNNIKCGNSLIDNQEIGKEKVFNWQKEFLQIMDGGGFDVIVGNPPWGSKIPMQDAEFIAKRFELPKKNLNLFTGFVLLSLKLLKTNGISELLIPKVSIKNSSYYELRKSIINSYNLELISNFGKFPGVASDAVSFSIRNIKAKNNFVEILDYINPESVERHKVNRKFYSENPTFAFSLDIDETKQNILNKLSIHPKLAENKLCLIKRGIELGQVSELLRCDSCGKHNEISKKYYSDKQKTCKFCNNKLSGDTFCISSRHTSDLYTLSAVSGKEIGKYIIKEKYYIPASISGIDYKSEIFSGDRIFLKRIATKPEGVFVGSKDNLFAFNTVYSIYNINGINPQALLGILNSKLLSFYYENVFNLGMSLTSQVTIEFLKELPIAKGSEKQIALLCNKVNEIQKYKFDFYSKINNVLDTLKQDFSIKSINKKLENFYDLSFEGFVELLLERQLSLEKKSNLHSFFSKEKEHVINLKTKIETLNNEINVIVFDIYGLSEQERYSILKQ